MVPSPISSRQLKLIYSSLAINHHKAVLTWPHPSWQLLMVHHEWTWAPFYSDEIEWHWNEHLFYGGSPLPWGIVRITAYSGSYRGGRPGRAPPLMEKMENIIIWHTARTPPPRFGKITDLEPPLLGFSGWATAAYDFLTKLHYSVEWVLRRPRGLITKVRNTPLRPLKIMKYLTKSELCSDI